MRSFVYKSTVSLVLWEEVILVSLFLLGNFSAGFWCGAGVQFNCPGQASFFGEAGSALECYASKEKCLAVAISNAKRRDLSIYMRNYSILPLMHISSKRPAFSVKLFSRAHRLTQGLQSLFPGSSMRGKKRVLRYFQFITRYCKYLKEMNISLVRKVSC